MPKKSLSSFLSHNLPICSKYSELIRNANTDNDIIDISLEVQPLEVITASVDTAWGLDSEYCINRFHPFLNGNYVLSKHHKGYSSEMFIRYNGDINLRTTVLSVISSNTDIYVQDNDVCMIYIGGKNNLNTIHIGKNARCHIYVYHSSCEVVTQGDTSHTKIFDMMKLKGKLEWSETERKKK